MPLEAATYVADLITTNPVGGDPVSQGDDHLRLIKAVLQTSFPNANKIFRLPTGTAEKVADYNVVAPTDSGLLIPVNASGAARTITCPTTSLLDGMFFKVVKTDTSNNAVTIAATATINEETSITLNRRGESALVFYNSTAAKWYAIISRRPFVTPTTLTGNHTLVAADEGRLFRIDATAAARTITLPNTLINGFSFVVSRIDGTTANAVTLDATSGGQINGANTLTLTFQYEMLHVYWNGSTWTASKISLTGITNAQLANMDSQRFKGRNTSGSGAPEDLTPLQAIGIIRSDTDGYNSLKNAFGYPDQTEFKHFANGSISHAGIANTDLDTGFTLRNAGECTIIVDRLKAATSGALVDLSFDNGSTFPLNVMSTAADVTNFLSSVIKITYHRITTTTMHIWIMSSGLTATTGFLLSAGQATGSPFAASNTGVATLRVRFRTNGASGGSVDNIRVIGATYS